MKQDQYNECIISNIGLILCWVCSHGFPAVELSLKIILIIDCHCLIMLQWCLANLLAVSTDTSLVILITWCRAANQYGISVFCTDFTCKIREYEFGLENTEIELCQFCHLKYCCQNKAYLFWVANQSGFVAFYALEPSNTSLITKTFNLLSSTCSSSMLSCLTSCSCSTGSIH